MLPKIKLAIKRFIQRNELCLRSIGKPIEKKVLFESYRGKTYSDNPRAISEALHEINPNISIIWALNGEDKYNLVPSYVKKINRKSSEYKNEFVTCSAFVTNEILDSCVIKRKQLFVQTWHGDRAFKKILYDVWTQNRRHEPIRDMFLTDFCVSGSTYGEHQFRSAFRYMGEIVKYGTPRDDCLINIDKDRIISIRSALGLNETLSLFIYAPTMRKASFKSKNAQPIQGIDLIKTLEILEKKYGGTWVCLLRAHPIITGLSGIEADGEKIIDVTDYPDMTDLLMISDCLITDYSSCAGDFALLRRPLFLFQDDIDIYKANDREFYFDMNESPYFIAHSQHELEEIIMSTSLEESVKNCDDILSFYKTYESGHSAEIIAKRIIDFIE